MRIRSVAWGRSARKGQRVSVKLSDFDRDLPRAAFVAVIVTR